MFFSFKLKHAPGCGTVIAMRMLEMILKKKFNNRRPQANAKVHIAESKGAKQAKSDVQAGKRDFEF